MNKEMSGTQKVVFWVLVAFCVFQFVREPTGPMSLTNFSSIGGEAAAEYYGW